MKACFCHRIQNRKKRKFNCNFSSHKSDIFLTDFSCSSDFLLLFTSHNSVYIYIFPLTILTSFSINWKFISHNSDFSENSQLWVSFSQFCIYMQFWVNSEVQDTVYKCRIVRKKSEIVRLQLHLFRNGLP